VTNETLKLSKIKTSGGDFESSLFVYVFNFLDYEDDFLYVLTERQHIDTALNKKLVRTCGYQLCTNEAHEDLVQSVGYHNSKLLETENVDKVLDDIFEEGTIIGRKDNG
tara:strand:- start:314 stop:640 length:327 start_codon:yes stop_codon:yes gene_type:complete